MAKETRTRGWCFTLNEWTDSDCGDLLSLYEYDTNITYMIVGFEKAPRTGTKHIQGYLYVTNPLRCKTVKEMLGKRYHIEPQRAAKNVEAYVYCMEDGDFLELGARPRQGHRTDLEAIKHDILKKKPMKEIANTYFSQWCQYRRSFDEYAKMHGIRERYTTKIVLYSTESMAASMREIYARDYIDMSLVVTKINLHIVADGEIWNMIYCGSYHTVYLPSDIQIKDELRGFVDEYIE